MPDHRVSPDEVSGFTSGLDLLASAVVLLDDSLRIRYLNPAAENLFEVSQRKLSGLTLNEFLGQSPELSVALQNALENNWSYTGHDLSVERIGGDALRLDCTVTPVEAGQLRLLLEFRPIDAQLRVAREEQVAQQQKANRELIRNLAHEIKNPLGGIRGSAQLLAGELGDPALREYTDVIIAEADRLQELMNRLLSARAMMRPAEVNIHDVLERVRRLVRAEYPGVGVERDYDTSLPELTGDREQLIQAVLNIARNAAQAMEGAGQITLRTRAARQATFSKRRHRLALELQVIDNGPGIPEHIRHTLFYPLVSGREGGSGLGLSIAQTFVEQHQGVIELESEPGRTCFTVFVPLSSTGNASKHQNGA